MRFRDRIPSELPSYNFENKFLQSDIKVPRFHCKIVDLVLLNSAALVSW